MISSVSSSLSILQSGMAAIGAAVTDTADNIANASSIDYRAQRGRMISQPLGVDYIRLPAQGEVDLGRQMVDLMQARTSYKALANAFRSTDEMEKQAVDLLA